MPATRRPIALAAAVATATALGATAFALPALAADKAPAAGAPAAGAPAAGPTVELKDGTLEWGFKESFRKYVTGMAAGKIEVADGAKQAANNGPFTFTDGKGTYDTAKKGTDTAFKGSVLFSSKIHAFDIKLADVKVVTEGKGGAIQADVTLNGATQNDIAVAQLDLTNVPPGQGPGGAMVFKDIPTKLTADGAKAFNGMYKEGDALDAATLTVTPVSDGQPSPKPTPSATATAPSPGPTATAPTQAPTATPSPTASTTGRPGPEEGAIVDGNLDWGVKKSFRSYVTGPIAHGKVELSGGAANSAAGYRFPKGKGSFDADEKSLAASFDGGVRFLGHKTGDEYLMDLSLSGFEVEAKGAKGTLVADVSTKDKKTQKVSVYENLGIATLTLPAGGPKAVGDVVTLSGVPAELTADGEKAFGGMYKKGEKLDALTVSVALDEDAQLPGDQTPAPGGDSAGSTGGDSGGTGGTAGGSTGGTVGGGSGGSVGGSGALATTGATVPTAALLSAAGVAAAAGAGVVFAIRRREAARS
ncbi:HtaA domain-containing protein [Streptomyces sp. NPDC051907]|uniref:HtaA domain-containing protein n=1 Tax=Streptomyces sp. NPDC051907 TaxID=3155284 RepID=UPI00341284F2